MNNTDMTAGQGITEKTDAAGETTPDNKRRGDQAEAGRTRIRTLRKGDNKPRILILKRRRGGVFQSNQSNESRKRSVRRRISVQSISFVRLPGV